MSYRADDLEAFYRPLAFAAVDDDVEEEEFFTEEGLLEDEDEPEEEPEEGDGPTPVQADGGFRRSAAGYVLLTLMGALPILLLVRYHQLSPGGLGILGMSAVAALAIGFVLSLVHLVLTLRRGGATPYQHRRFFAWHEILVATLVLVPLGLANIGQTLSGHFLGLSATLKPISIVAFLGALIKPSGDATLLPAVTPALQAPLFWGGALWGTLGYALAIGLAGALIMAMRGMPGPFGSDEEPGMVKRLLGVPYHFLIGLSHGATLGWLFGMSTIGLVYLLFVRHGATPPLSSWLTALGASTHPDLAFTHGFTLSALTVPLMFLFVAKPSPPGRTIQEEEIRQQYEIAAPAKALIESSQLPEPTMISFGDLDDDLDADALGVDDSSLTDDILTEFGHELQAVFGIQPPAHVTVVEPDKPKVDPGERKALAAALEQSFGELSHVNVQISAQIGQASILLTDWLHLTEGMLLELNQPVSEEIDILFNGVPKGKGRLSVVDNHLGIQVSHLRLEE